MNAEFDAAQAKLLQSINHLLEGDRGHPFRSSKIIHDAIWGTCTYEPWEVGILDLPIFQRLRGIKQTGFAYLTYPAAEHSRFQHVLGVVEAATRVFDSLHRRRGGDGLSPAAQQARANRPLEALGDDNVDRYRRLLRLATLVHDLGHSLLSHTSERIFAMLPPFPQLIQSVKGKYGKKPGAAELVVYLLVTSSRWQSVVGEIWERCSGPQPSPSTPDWEQMGRWVMGIEPSGDYKFLCDVVSGPLDADKLDYIARDAYFAGIPVSHDLDRFLSTVCVNRERDKDTGKEWYRLTVPLQRGINALEQLVMSRLVLFSYLYHHQKVRAAEVLFERRLVREYISSGKKTFARLASSWDLFAIQDAHLYAESGGKPGVWAIADIPYRRLPRRVAEFREQDVTVPESGRSRRGYQMLSQLTRPSDWDKYENLLEFEDKLATRSGLPAGSVIVDFPQEPAYGDLQSLVLPGRDPEIQTTAKEHLSYSDWIEAYNKHRLYARVFYVGSEADSEGVWRTISEEFTSRHLRLRPGLRVLK